MRVTLSPKYKYVGIALIFCVIGVIAGIIIQGKKPIEIDEKIRYSEILNWISTLAIGVIIGYYLKNDYENNKIIKTYLLEDLNSISSQLILVKTYCFDLRSVSSFSEEQRKEVISKVNVLDKKITVFLELLKDCDANKHASINEGLVNGLNSFNRKLTSDGLYDDPIQQVYFDEIMSESAKFQSEVRRIMLTIIRTM
jgi:hypothetical protein